MARPSITTTIAPGAAGGRQRDEEEAESLTPPSFHDFLSSNEAPVWPPKRISETTDYCDIRRRRNREALRRHRNRLKERRAELANNILETNEENRWLRQLAEHLLQLVPDWRGAYNGIPTTSIDSRLKQLIESELRQI